MDSTKLSCPLGVAVNSEKLFSDHQYSGLVQSNFRRLSTENAFKADHIHPSLEQYDFTSADLLVEHCAEHHKLLHGHTLVWHRAQPAWMQSASKDQLIEHLRVVAARYRTKVQSWDLVNEAFDENGKLRDSPWNKKLGPDYISTAFGTLSEIDPEARLFYNDFDLECNPVKRGAVLSFIKNMRGNGIPIHGLGLQLHQDLGFYDIQQLKSTFEQFADLGLLIHISECDVSVSDNSPQNLQAQAEVLRQVLTAYSLVPAAQQFGVTFWGLRDQDSWLNEKRMDHPLLFDRQGQPKPMHLVLNEFFKA